MKKKIVSALLLTGVMGMSANQAMHAYASDHIDSPTLAHDHATDLNDTYAFLDPNDNSQIVLMMSTNPFVISSEAIGQAIFDSNVRYRFEIENTGDAIPDLFVDVHYTKGVGRLTTQTATITLPNGRSFKAETTVSLQGNKPPRLVVSNDTTSGVSFFAGSTDDPFFLDNTAANRFVLSSIMHPGKPDKTVFRKRAGADRIGRDTYAGFNALITAVRIPVAMLKGKDSKEIGVNSVAQRQRHQIVTEDGDVNGEGDWLTLDRSGIPLINNGLIPTARKNEYNSATTQQDAQGKFRADLIQSLKNFGTDDAHIAMILKVAQERGDILRVRTDVLNTGTNMKGGFPNGRRLTDDVADGTFTLINNGIPLGDFVSGNEAPFRKTFPFVADPIQPNPKGVDNPDDRTRL